MIYKRHRFPCWLWQTVDQDGYAYCPILSVIMLFVYMKCRFSLSYRDLEEIMIIHEAEMNHSTIQHSVC